MQEALQMQEVLKVHRQCQHKGCMSEFASVCVSGGLLLQC